MIQDGATVHSGSNDTFMKKCTKIMINITLLEIISLMYYDKNTVLYSWIFILNIIEEIYQFIKKYDNTSIL